MMLLSHLPPPILDLIFGNSDYSYLIIKLWKTGNVLLCSQLAQGITYVNLRHHENLQSSYPRFLSCLPKLRTLSLYSNSNIIGESIDTWTDVLKHLPTTLESLTIESPDSCWSILSGQDTTPRLLPLACMYPALHTLGIRGYQHRSNKLWPKILPVQPGDFVELPSSLTCLKWNIISVKTAEMDLFAMLPRSLTSLEASVDFDRLTVGYGQHAPPNLTYVEKLIVKTFDDGSRLPPSITNSIRAYSEIASLRALPPVLTEVTLAGSTLLLDDWIPLLPRGLTKLIDLNQGPSLLPRHILCLPETMTHLVISSSLDLVGIKAALGSTSLWLPRLEHLECIIDHMEPGLLAILPRNLTCLNVHFQVEQHPDPEVAISGEELPPHLSDLNISISSGKSCKLTSMLPSSLKSIHWKSVNATQALGEENMKQLPNSITELIGSLNLPQDSPIYDSLLPVHLTSLSLNTFSARWLSTLPRKLVTLSIGTLEHLCMPYHRTLFEGLPPDLENLSLRNLKEAPDGVLFSDASFSSLPKLTSLYILSNACFASGVLRGLSRRLTTLILSLESLEEVDLPFISPLLCSVRFGPKVVLKTLPNIVLHCPMNCGYLLNEPEESAVHQRLRNHLSS